MKYCMIGARGGVGCTSLALALGRTLNQALYLSLDFGAKDAAKNLRLDPGIYDLYDLTNRGGELTDALLESEDLGLLEAPLTKSLKDLDREGLKALAKDLEESYDHLIWDLPIEGLDLLEILDPDQIYCLASKDLAAIYRLEDLLFKLRGNHDRVTPIITGVDNPETLRTRLEEEGLDLGEVKTLPFSKASDGETYFYPKDFAKIITEDMQDYQEAQDKRGLLSKLFRGNP